MRITPFLNTRYYQDISIQTGHLYQQLVFATANMPLTGTIIELLTEANPRINLQSQPMGSVTKSALYKPLDADDLSDWSDFTYDNIKARSRRASEFEDVVLRPSRSAGRCAVRTRGPEYIIS